MNIIYKYQYILLINKAMLEQLFQIMKKDFTLIKESKPCFSIIQLIEIIEESKTSIVFTTERIICSLSDVLNNFDNIINGNYIHRDFFQSGK